MRLLGVRVAGLGRRTGAEADGPLAGAKQLELLLCPRLGGCDRRQAGGRFRQERGHQASGRTYPSWAEAAPWRAECAGRVEDVTSESFAGQGTYTLTATDLDLNAA